MNFELALIDMDGTIYSGETRIDGVNNALKFLEEQGVEVFFLTNYAGREREAYSEKLEKMGIDASSEEVVTSGWLTAKYISQNFPEAEVFVLGEKDLEEELINQDIKVVENCDNPEILVVSNKHDLRYEDLKEVLQGVDEETQVLGTNPDETIPGEDGEIPGAGTIIKAVETMTGKKVKIIGKPSENAVETVTEMENVSPENCVMIGDRLNTDILMVEETGMESVLVLSGVSSEETVKNSDISPDHIVNSIKNIQKIL